MHPVILPDKSEGGLSELTKYILHTCEKHRTENRALAFAFIVSDLNDPQITKILRDNDYINALDVISGKYVTIFYLHDNFLKEHVKKARNSSQIRLELEMHAISGPPNLSPRFIAKNLINDENLPSPSVLFFQVNNGVITDYTIAQLKENEIEKGFNELKKMIKVAVNSLSEVTADNRGNSDELFNLLKSSIKSSIFWRTAKRLYKNLIQLKDFVSFWSI